MASWQFTIAGYAGRFVYVTAVSSTFFLPTDILWFAFAAIPFAARRRSNQFLLAAFVWTVLGMSLATWFDWHYAAPVLAVYLALWAECLRSLGEWRYNRIPLGRWVAAGALFLLAATGAARLSPTQPGGTSAPSKGQDWGRERLSFAARLKNMGGEHLVVVTYPPNHSVKWEWVYNSADIDAAPVVWARDLGPGRNAPLLAYFRSRHRWRVTMKNDSAGITLSPWAPADTAMSPPGPSPGQRIGSTPPANLVTR